MYVVILRLSWLHIDRDAAAARGMQSGVWSGPVRLPERSCFSAFLISRSNTIVSSNT